MMIVGYNRKSAALAHPGCIRSDARLHAPQQDLQRPVHALGHAVLCPGPASRAQVHRAILGDTIAYIAVLTFFRHGNDGRFGEFTNDVTVGGPRTKTSSKL